MDIHRHTVYSCSINQDMKDGAAKDSPLLSSTG